MTSLEARVRSRARESFVFDEVGGGVASLKRWVRAARPKRASNMRYIICSFHRGTLERLRERMERAYSAKEQEVEKELGVMRDQFTQELRNMTARGATDHQADKENIIDEDHLDQNLESEDLKKFYVAASRQISRLK
jgi:hypothetical protein